MRLAGMVVFSPGRRIMSCKHLMNTTIYFISPYAIITTSIPNIKSHNGASLNIYSALATADPPNYSKLAICFLILRIRTAYCYSRFINLFLQNSRFEVSIKLTES